MRAWSRVVGECVSRVRADSAMERDFQWLPMPYMRTPLSEQQAHCRGMLYGAVCAWAQSRAGVTRQKGGDEQPAERPQPAPAAPPFSHFLALRCTTHAGPRAKASQARDGCRGGRALSAGAPAAQPSSPFRRVPDRGDGRWWHQVVGNRGFCLGVAAPSPMQLDAILELTKVQDLDAAAICDVWRSCASVTSVPVSTVVF